MMKTGDNEEKVEGLEEAEDSDEEGADEEEVVGPEDGDKEGDDEEGSGRARGGRG